MALEFGVRRCGIYLEVRAARASTSSCSTSVIPLCWKFPIWRGGGAAGRRGGGAAGRHGCSQATDRSNGCFQVIPGSHLRGVVAHAPGTGTMAQVRRRRYPLAPSTVHRALCPSALHNATGVDMYSRWNLRGLLRRRSHGGQGEWATVDEAAAVDLEVGTGPCSSCPLPDCFPRWAYVAPVLLKRAPY